MNIDKANLEAYEKGFKVLTPIFTIVLGLLSYFVFTEVITKY